MSTPAEPTPPQVPLKIKVISHTGMLYFWPVWLTGFILAGLTYAEDTRLAVVPVGTTVKEVEPKKVYQLTVPEPAPALANAANAEKGQPAFPVRIAQNKNYGVVYVIVLLLVIFGSTVPLRGLAAVIEVMAVLLVTPPAGNAVIQVLPTGPDARVDAIEQVVLMALYAATREVVLTTPYFVPSEALLLALLSAAARGVQVTLIVPAKVDSRLVHYASRAFQSDLLAAGVRVALYQGGFLHTKSITVDGQFSLFGSLNLDPRSLRLDFEITLVVHDADFTAALRRLQQVYLERSALLDGAACRARSALERFQEDAARLVGPVL